MVNLQQTQKWIITAINPQLWPTCPRPLVECWPIYSNPTMPIRQTLESHKCHHHFPKISEEIKRQIQVLPQLLDKSLTLITHGQYPHISPWLLINIRVHDQPLAGIGIFSSPWTGPPGPPDPLCHAPLGSSRDLPPHIRHVWADLDWDWL